jgi:hypothetical protein
MRERTPAQANAPLQNETMYVSEPLPLLSINEWSDLAIGIDERSKCWAITPPPEPGKVFRKTKAVELPLPAGRWTTVLTALAESETGCVVARADLLYRMGLLSPGASFEVDKRAEPGAIEGEHVEGMQINVEGIRKTLNLTLADLRRKLRELVAVTNEDPICLKVDKELVRSGFVVRYLLQNEDGELTFGGSTK